MDNNHSKEATGYWTALKQLRRNRISQSDADSDAASAQASSSDLLTASSWKLRSVFTTIESSKPSPKTQIFFFILVQENGER